MGPAERCDLLELLDDCTGTRSTLITSQLSVKAWHTALGDPMLADAIFDPAAARLRRLCQRRAVGVHALQARHRCDSFAHRPMPEAQRGSPCARPSNP